MRVEARIGQCADTDTIGFIFVLAREIYLLLRRRSLRDRHRSLDYIATASSRAENHRAEH